MRKSWLRFALVALLPLCGWGCTSSPKSAESGDSAKSWWSNPFGSSAEKNEISYNQVSSEADPLSLKHKSKTGPELYIATARVQEQQQNYDGAKAQYEKALKEAPNNYPALIAYARMEDRRGNSAAAIKLYQQAIAKHPQQAGAYNDLGLCHARAGKYMEASNQLAKAVEKLPSKALYRNNYATVLIEQNRLQEAASQLSAVHPPAVANYNVAILLQKKGNPAAAQYMTQAAQLDPNFMAAREWLQANGALAAAPATQPTYSPVSYAQPQSQPYGSQYPAAAPAAANYPSTARGPEFTAQSPLAPQSGYAPANAYPQPGYAPADGYQYPVTQPVQPQYRGAAGDGSMAPPAYPQTPSVPAGGGYNGSVYPVRQSSFAMPVSQRTPSYGSTQELVNDLPPLEPQPGQLAPRY